MTATAGGHRVLAREAQVGKQVWEQIRSARLDLTDYVVHLTRRRSTPHYVHARDVLLEILRTGYIRPTFAEKVTNGPLVITVKGPEPAVCLTEQPIEAILKTLPVAGGRYAAFGLAYHKVPLHSIGGRPVLYGTWDVLGREIGRGQKGYQKGKQIYTGGLPENLQYLWVKYEPKLPGKGEYPLIGRGRGNGEFERTRDKSLQRVFQSCCRQTITLLPRERSWSRRMSMSPSSCIAWTASQAKDRCGQNPCAE
jgi:hypothetical protein